MSKVPEDVVIEARSEGTVYLWTVQYEMTATIAVIASYLLLDSNHPRLY
jgi:hypothetical protein